MCLASLTYLVLGNSLLAISLLLAMVRRGEASRVSSLFFLVPPATALIAFGVLGETLSAVATALATVPSSKKPAASVRGVQVTGDGDCGSNGDRR